MLRRSGMLPCTQQRHQCTHRCTFSQDLLALEGATLCVTQPSMGKMHFKTC